MKKHIFAVVLATIVMVALLAGCSGGRMSAEEVIRKSQESLQDNYRAETWMSLGLSVAAGEGEEGAASLDLPITFTIDLERAGGLSHGKITAKLSMMGQSQKTSSEFYDDSKNLYSSEDGTYWVCRDTRGVSLLSCVSPEGFSGAKVSYKKETGVYTITQSLESLLKDKSVREAVEKMLADVEGIDIDEAIAGLEGGEVVIKVDGKTFKLFRCDINDVAFSVEIEDGGVAMKVEIRLDAEIDYSDFGEVKEEDVAVPESVKASAEEGFGGLDDFPGNPEPAEVQMPEADIKSGVLLKRKRSSSQREELLFFGVRNQ